MRSGVIDLSRGFRRVAGIYGFQWSSVAATYTGITSANAYDLYVLDYRIEPSHGPFNRWHGSPVRCLASGA